MKVEKKPVIGVVIVSFNSGDVILDCLESLLAVTDTDLRILVVDNASPDDTVEILRKWAAAGTLHDAGNLPYRPRDHGPVSLIDISGNDQGTALPNGAVGLLQTGLNTGFAGGVNRGMAALAACPEIDAFWILNPDAMTLADTPAALARGMLENPGFGLMGGRIYYTDPATQIQGDGGTINRYTGICIPINLGAMGPAVPPPRSTDLDFVSGAHMLASRAMLETTGGMVEDYFLYYEEVDWAMRRGALDLVYLDDAIVHHHGGTAIGSPTLERGPSPLSSYFTFRNRMRFQRRFSPWSLPMTWAYSMAKIAYWTLTGQRAAAWAAWAGMNGLRAPADIRARFTGAAKAHAFAPMDISGRGPLTLPKAKMHKPESTNPA